MKINTDHTTIISVASALGAIILLSFGASIGYVVHQFIDTPQTKATSSEPTPDNSAKGLVQLATVDRQELSPITESFSTNIAPQPHSVSSPPVSAPAKDSRMVVTYRVTTAGHISANLAEFRSFANSTLNDSRGWSKLQIVFTEVPTGGDFTLILAEAGTLPQFSSGCSTTLSCRVGRNVIINQDRWLNGTGAWSNGGGSLTDYRHMVINHEVGHWLGHDHKSCSAGGSAAPIMQQQSISLNGCKPNAWPLQSDLSAPRFNL